MTFRRLFLFAVPLAVAVVVGSCTRDADPTGVAAPHNAPATSLVGSALAPTGLLTCSPLPPAAATATIGRRGGVIQVGPHVLAVPPRALDEPVTITAEIVPGPVNAVRFTPEGLQFERSARLTMSYANCNLLGQLVPKRIAYVDDQLAILEYLVSLDLFRLQVVAAPLDHFSSYALAW